MMKQITLFTSDASGATQSRFRVTQSRYQLTRAGSDWGTLAESSPSGTGSRSKSFSRGVRAFLVATLVLVAAQGCSAKKGTKGGADGSDGFGRDGLSESDLAARQASRFNGNSIPTAEGEGPFRDVHFDYDSSIISSEARSDIEANAQLLRENPGVRITLEGHCDERGTEDYNLTLGQTRAKNVKDALVAQGIAASRIDTISYGENIPLDAGHSESAWAKNRRVHFSGAGMTRGGSGASLQDSGRGRMSPSRRQAATDESAENDSSLEEDARSSRSSTQKKYDSTGSDAWDYED